MIGYFRRNPALLGVLSLIVLLTVTGCLFSKDFRSVQNFQNVFEQSAPLAFTALGQTVVIITRGIDLSIDARSRSSRLLLLGSSTATLRGPSPSFSASSRSA